MDRDFENLPRMQVAFIDAVVHPVFRLLADFLPLVEDHCIKPLQLNRAFWHSMLHRGILKSDDIITFLEAQKSNDPFILTSTEGFDAADEHDSSINSSDGDIHAPIPGIPANAKESERDIRRASVISLNHEGRHVIDEELGVRLDESMKHEKRLSLHTHVVKSSQGAYRITIAGMKKLLESHIFQALTFIATIYALFAFDLNLALGTKNGDIAVDYTTFAVLIIFIVELVLSLACVVGYIQFFFWLDLVATVSLYFEIGFLLQARYDLSSNQFSLCRATCWYYVFS